ncbi:DNA-packaging protein [Ancylobacter dichloromethanicus]|uniref:DNA-packaging protein n=1 Tax=Ancylobacter dichloromethanicus TaxID=518825 RepID=A0A9W6J4Y6_9HYPH|nr:terminase family protein [Ancylobacter dichloromethanicus]MBS7556137.1 DNA-packaging protein [Ancylobacter dichloromethanicus]GLK69891.1 DNA-packaging protein [Ancylobacter dichloromethanicus]
MSACWRAGKLPEALAALDAPTLDWLRHHWPLIGRAGQLPPALAQGGGDWLTWLMLGGRGAGKTRAGAEWVRALVHGRAGPRAGRLALVAESHADVREVMVEGVSGLLAIHPRHERPLWEPTRRRLQWPNGAVAQGFSADDPESLRGPQFDAAWCDELAKWRYAQAAFDMLQFGLRLGARPRQMVTTTPRPTALIRALLKDPRSAVTRMATGENAAHLAPSFLQTVVGRYAGTRLGRQEIDGELIEDRADALWNRAGLEAGREAAAPELTGRMARIVVAVDPPASSTRRADACGLIAAGIDADGIVHVLADESAQGLSPNGWGARAIGLFQKLEADRVVVEVNQGGEMVKTILAGIDPTVPVSEVRATRGKWLRAEPVAALYEQGRVRHAGPFPALEDELCDFGPDGLSNGRSPDRLDALVWAVTALALGPRAVAPRVRRV